MKIIFSALAVLLGTWVGIILFDRGGDTYKALYMNISNDIRIK